MQSVLVFSGPSGGHLFPAQAFAEAARERGFQDRIVLVTSVRARGLCEKIPAGIFDAVEYLPEFGSPAGVSLSGLSRLLNIPIAIWKSGALLARYQPALSVGFGSFVSYFGMLFSVWRGIPTLIHEQNQVPGKATRMLQGWVKTVAISFPQTDFKKKPHEVVFTGLPIRKSVRLNPHATFKKAASPFTVLICGGSQGSAFLNSAVLDAWNRFSAEERARFAVIHITGAGQDEKVRQHYHSLKMRAEVFPFFEAMQELYQKSHLAVSRAGANSSFEQAGYGIPTIFIPYPHAEGHQIDNAQYFVDHGGAKMFKQDQSVGVQIYEALKEWTEQPDRYLNAAQKMQALAQEKGHEVLWLLAEKMLKIKP